MSSSRLTKEAVRTMVRGAEIDKNEELCVQIFAPTPKQRDDEVMVYDGKDRVRAILLNCDTYNKELVSMASVKGYVVSQANLNHDDPVLCLTHIKIWRTTRNLAIIPQGDCFQLTQARISGGRIPGFLKDVAPYLSMKALSGALANAVTLTTSTANDTKLKVVADFLSKHKAMLTLHRSSSNVSAESGSSDTTTSHHTPTRASTEIYTSVLQSFQAAQLDRQKASLTSNAGRADAATAEKVTHQHQAALQYLLDLPPADELTLENLHACHANLCQGLVDDAGRLRSKNVRVAFTNFCPHERVAATLDQLLPSIRTLRSRLIQNVSANDERVEAGVTFCAAVFMGIIDTHPYSDGNGRLARIAINWALKRAGFPFVIHLFATPTQRAEYSESLRRTRRNIDLISRGNVLDEMLLEAYQRVGVFRPIVQLLMDRIYKAVAEFNKMVDEKSSLHWEESEQRIARKFRERAAAGSCLICFDANPNIATLCCGNAVHLNCMAEWLSNNNSCPQCRSELPPMPARRQRAASPDSNDDTTSNVDDEDSETIGFLHAVADDEATTMDDDDTTTASVVAPPEPPAVNYDTVTTNDTTDLVAALAAQQQNFFCFNCNNRAARDCDNNACGRCCLTTGRFQCSRHS